jgi:hypothetical protein
MEVEQGGALFAREDSVRTTAAAERPLARGYHRACLDRQPGHRRGWLVERHLKRACCVLAAFRRKGKHATPPPIRGTWP